MTTHTSIRTRNVWNDSRTIVSTSKARPPRPAHTEPPKSTMKAQSEQEADRWVAEMMFTHYNG
jgi:hypothetical protein